MSDDRYAIDATHSRFGFAARHMMVATVRGQFHEFSGFVTAPDGDLTRGEIEVTVNAASIDTNSTDRDAHLRSADFFDAENHPDITFRSTSVTRAGEDQYAVTGDLTMRGVTRPVTLRGAIEGRIADPYGFDRVAGTFTGRVNRRDWGLNWNLAIEAGGVVVGDEVRLELDVTVVRRVAAAANA
jgi:polyisoprenoid-binding protein YceI